MPKVMIEKHNHNRVILTDTLPYETPLFFTNEPLYHFISNDDLNAKLPSYLRKLLYRRSATKPFLYEVRKSGGGLRKLAVPHPAAQIGFADFYRDFDSFIESVCSRSSYSLRYPARVASHYYQSQYASKAELSRTPDKDPSSFSSQRRWASSYFSYQRFNHIQKYFGSTEFLNLEQQFSWMLKLDIARCFESIYTHSIVWAVRGKLFGKENKFRRFFESEFDKRMQDANWGETNGILIGPEVSRIFAECIMQSIDVELAEKLGPDARKIAVSRYVDDFFLLSNSKDLLTKAQEHLESIASKYNLHFNKNKTELTPRPFAAPLAVARQRVRILISETFRIAKANLSEESPDDKFSPNAADKVLAEVRRIASQYSVDYSILASPALAVIVGGLSQLRARIGKSIPDFSRPRVDLINHCFIRISTFFYLMDIRAATSDKLAKVFLECSRLNEASGSGRLSFEGLMQDSLRLALAQAKLNGTTGPEVVNVLVAADAVCKNLKGVTPDLVKSALGAERCWVSRCTELNYFDLVSILYLSRERHSFRSAREAACAEIEKRILRLGRRLGDYAEETMLFFDYMSCPYLPTNKRLALYTKISRELGNSSGAASTQIDFELVSTSIRFVAWDGAESFPEMLARRELQPAYDS